MREQPNPKKEVSSLPPNPAEIVTSTSQYVTPQEKSPASPKADAAVSSCPNVDEEQKHDHSGSAAKSILDNRFEIYHSNPSVLVSIGNHVMTEATEGARKLSDCAKVIPIVEDGVIIGYIQVTADGLGHLRGASTGVNAERRRINTYSAQLSRKVVDLVSERISFTFSNKKDFTKEDMQQCLLAVGEKTNDYLQKKYANRQGQGIDPKALQTCVVATVTLLNRSGTKYVAGGVGNLTALLINAETGDILEDCCIHDESYIEQNVNGKQVSFPKSIQAVARDGSSGHGHIQLVEKQFGTESNDPKRFLSTQFSDGIGNFLPRKTSKDEKKQGGQLLTQTTHLDLAKFQSHLKESFNLSGQDAKSSPSNFISPHQLTRTLNNSAVDNLQKVRDRWSEKENVATSAERLCEKLINGYATPQPESQTSYDKNQEIRRGYTVAQLLKDLNTGVEKGIYGIDSSRFSREVITYCNETAERYKVSQQQPAAVLISKLQAKPRGDDATCSTVEILDYDVQCLRAWLYKPVQKSVLRHLCQLDEAQLKRAAERLTSQVYIPESAEGAHFYSQTQTAYEKAKIKQEIGLISAIKGSLLADVMLSFCDATKGLDQSSADEIFEQLNQFLSDRSEDQLKAFEDIASKLPGSPDTLRKIGSVTMGLSLPVGGGLGALAVFVFYCSLLSPPTFIAAGGGLLVLLCVGLAIRYFARPKGPSKAVKQLSGLLSRNGFVRAPSDTENHLESQPNSSNENEDEDEGEDDALSSQR